ncbi:MAG TPA: hypothetical protein VF765_31420 [Polyangiaceae bacterium]
MRKRRFATVASGALVALILGLSTSRARADVPITEEARTHFAAGVALLQDPKAPRYEDAYREFKAAYAASPSYKILGNLGLCAMKIERDAEAIDAYEKYLKEATELSPAERQQAERDLLTLKTGVVTITVSSNPPGAYIEDVRTPIEGNDVRNAYGQANAPLTLGIRRGHHVITAHLEGYTDQRWEFEASGTTLPPHEFTLVKPVVAVSTVPETTTSRPLPTAAYVSGAVTLGLVATGFVFGIAAVSAHNDFNTVNTDGLHQSQAQSDKNRGQAFNIVADSCFGAAILGAALTAYFVLARPTVEHPIAATAEVHRGLTLTPTPLFGPGGQGGAGGGLAAVWVY